MSYPSVDQLQKVLSDKIFHYAKDKKKAAGRALGTLVEVIIFYLLKTWRFESYLAIERPLSEYSNKEITHNVEYSLHPSINIAQLDYTLSDLPLTESKISKALEEKGFHISRDDRKSNQLISSKMIIRNACTIAEENGSFLVASLKGISGDRITVIVNRLFNQPFSIFECKRVGIEEGTRKGPQTIEKAKQGTYVARTVSSLQKIRLADGKIGGVFAPHEGKLVCKPYGDYLQEVIASSEPELLRRFILTVGIVSNHGNWFTSDNHNKELKVLAQSYDWLLFLTDQGLAEFIQDLILKPAAKYESVRKAFLASYLGKSGANQFTKVKMNLYADQILQEYFIRNLGKIESWFNVISQKNKNIHVLHGEITALAGKNWTEIHA
jgi:hypothetical protein